MGLYGWALEKTLFWRHKSTAHLARLEGAEDEEVNGKDGSNKQVDWPLEELLVITAQSFMLNEQP